MGAEIWALINPPRPPFSSTCPACARSRWVLFAAPPGWNFDLIGIWLPLYRHPVEPRALEPSKRTGIFVRDGPLVQHTNRRSPQHTPVVTGADLGLIVKLSCRIFARRDSSTVVGHATYLGTYVYCMSSMYEHQEYCDHARMSSTLYS